MKQYIKPEIDCELMVEEEMICDSDTSNVHNIITDNVQLSKERESVDFSDSESIW